MAYRFKINRRCHFIAILINEVPRDSKNFIDSQVSCLQMLTDIQFSIPAYFEAQMKMSHGWPIYFYVQEYANEELHKNRSLKGLSTQVLYFHKTLSSWMTVVPQLLIFMHLADANFGKPWRWKSFRRKFKEFASS